MMFAKSLNVRLKVATLSLLVFAGPYAGAMADPAPVKGLVVARGKIDESKAKAASAAQAKDVNAAHLFAGVNGVGTVRSAAQTSDVPPLKSSITVDSGNTK
jgi:hypothetical protein